MRECGNRVNSKAPVLTPSEIHFCCARHNPNAKTFSPQPSPSPRPEPGLHFASFISQIFFFFLCHVLKTKEPAPGSGLEGWREGSQKRLKLNLVMERSLFSLTRDRLLNTSN